MMIELCKPNAITSIIISRRWDSLHGWLPISSYLIADSQYGWLLTLPLRQGCVISRWTIYELPLRLGYITSRWMTSDTPTQTETNKISWCIISMGEQYSADISSIFRHMLLRWWHLIRQVETQRYRYPAHWATTRQATCMSTSRWVWLHWIHRINELYQAKQDLRIHRLIPPHTWSLVRSGYI